jgi:DNA-binding LacI/PurR family transcriptional regulator
VYTLPITIKDIAKAAGVSHSPISRAVGGHPGIPKQATERIKNIASDMEYVPSAVARGLKTNRSNTLGVIVNRIDDPFFSEILQGIENVLLETGYSLFVTASNRDFGREKNIVQTMRERRVDGIQVPRDCSAGGFDDIPFTAYTYPPLATFGQPKYQLGYKAAQMMSELMQSHPDINSANNQTILLRGELVVRETTAPPLNE